ncbi:MAG: hypothetical protein ACRDRN_17845 [Sciscionella sp.]
MSRIRRVSTETVPVPAPAKPAVAPRRRLASAMWIVTTALVLLALLVIGGAAFSRTKGMAGPSTLEIAAHVVGAVVAVLLQRSMRRGALLTRMLAALAIVAVLATLLWFFWWH